MKPLLVLFVVALLVAVRSVDCFAALPQAHTLVLQVTNYEARCLYASTNTKADRVFFHFQSLAGSLEFTVNVKHPDGTLIFSSTSDEHKGESKIYFETHMPGELAFCIEGNSNGDKIISMSVAVMSQRRLQKRIDPLMRSFQRSESILSQLAAQQAYMRTREREHRETLESNNTRVAIQGVLEILLMLAMSVGQVIMLQRLFDQKRTRPA